MRSSNRHSQPPREARRCRAPQVRAVRSGGWAAGWGGGPPGRFGSLAGVGSESVGGGDCGVCVWGGVYVFRIGFS